MKVVVPSLVPRVCLLTVVSVSRMLFVFVFTVGMFTVGMFTVGFVLFVLKGAPLLPPRGYDVCHVLVSCFSIEF